jgi:hypothetical protein
MVKSLALCLFAPLLWGADPAFNTQGSDSRIKISQYIQRLSWRYPEIPDSVLPGFQSFAQAWPTQQLTSPPSHCIVSGNGEVLHAVEQAIDE